MSRCRVRSLVVIIYVAISLLPESLIGFSQLWPGSGKQASSEGKSRDALTVFVVGRVHHGGAYVFAPGMTVSEVIVEAGGLSPRSRSGNRSGNVTIEIRRQTKDGVKIFVAKLSDQLIANDIVVVKRRPLAQK